MVAGSIDYMFSQLSLTGNVWATTIAGFVLVLIIVFGAIAVFGKSKQELGAFGILVFTFLGTLLATAVGLFPWFIIIIFLVVSFIIIILGKIFGGNGNG